MAQYSVEHAKHGTLSGTTIDTVVITGEMGDIEVVNREGTAPLYVTTDDSTPAAEADNTEFVAPGASVTLSPETRIIKIIGNTNEYSVTAL